jgi:hypothetical protein
VVATDAKLHRQQLETIAGAHFQLFVVDHSTSTEKNVAGARFIRRWASWSFVVGRVYRFHKWTLQLSIQFCFSDSSRKKVRK